MGLLAAVLAAGTVRADTTSSPSLLTSRPVRMTLETAGGLGGAAVTILTSTLAVCALTAGGQGYCAVPGVLLGTLLSPLGIGVGVWLVGDLLDGNGSYLAATLGAVVGIAIGALSVVALSNTSVPPASLGLAAVTLPAFVSALGYELTSDASRSKPSVSLAPTFTTDGAGFAITGRF